MRASSVILAALVALSLSAPTRAATQNATLRFQIIEADGFTDTDPAIQDVQRVLQDMFRCQGYRLAGEAVIRVGGGEFHQQIAVSDDVRFYLRADYASVEDQAVMIHSLELMQEHLGGDQRDTSFLLSASLTLPVGQTVVVGSARPSADSPVIVLAVRALPG